MRLFRPLVSSALTPILLLPLVVDGRFTRAAEEGLRFPCIDEWTPSRITAMVFEYTSQPPWHKHNLQNGFAFLGADLNRNPHDTHVSLQAWMPLVHEYSGYWAHYPRMELYTLFPVLGKLYCFDATSGGRVSAFRLNDDELPAGVKLGRDTYIFPSVTPRKSTQETSGDLFGSKHILVGPIQREGTEETAGATARILTTDSRNWSAWRDDDKIDDWQVVRAGDIVSFGRYPLRYRVVNIVPPDTKGHMVRGHLCKMIGWIELDRKAIRPIEEQRGHEVESPRKP